MERAGPWRQWRTSPDWAMVNPMNTPMANMGISRCVFPFTATSNTAEKPVRVQIPALNTLAVAAQGEEVGQIVVRPQEGCGQHRGARRSDVLAASAKLMVMSS